MFTLEESALLGRLLRFVGWSVVCLLILGAALILPPPVKAHIAAGIHSLESEIGTLAHKSAQHLHRPRT